jgi:hypothetical protein
LGTTNLDGSVTITGVVIPMGWNAEGHITSLGIAASDETNYLIAPGPVSKKLADMLQREVTIWGRTRGEKPNQTIIVEKVEMKTGSKGGKWSLVVGTIICFGLLVTAGVSPALAAGKTVAGAKTGVKASKPAQKTTAKAKVSKKTVKPNAKVKAAQNALTKAGFKCSPDGIMGKKTKAAIKKFQKKNGLKVNGKLDKATRAKLGV